MHYMNISKIYICMHYLSMKKNWTQLNCLIHCFWFLKMKITLKTRTQITKIDSKGHPSNLFLDFFIRLTWHHSNYSHIPIHCNYEIVNVIKIQNNPL